MTTAPIRLELPDGSWEVEVFLDRSEPGFDDNVFVRITEKSPKHSKLLSCDQITIGVTAADARKLAQRLVEVAEADESAALGEMSPARSGRKRRPAPPAPFTPKQGKYLAFIHDYWSRFGRSPAEADIQCHFLVSAPTVNQMVQRLERLGLIARTPGQARSIHLIIPPQLIPPL